MKRIEGFKGLAKEMGVPESKIKSVYEDYAQIAQGKKKDPFGKKFFDNWETDPNDVFYVAQMEPVLHYTMGGVEINAQSQVIGENGKPIEGLWASGELAGGVHGANRLGGSSLLCVFIFIFCPI
jgi:succinate dehydrogenase/fumarate reductase flavoprotein subunit